MGAVEQGELGLTIFPPSGVLVTTSKFDLTLIVQVPGRSVVGGAGTFDGFDVTSGLGGCIILGTLPSGGQTFRCPGLQGSIFMPGTHTLSVMLDLDDGSQVSNTVIWKILANTEP